MIKLFLIIFLFTTTAYARTYDEQAVDCIVGEASSEGYIGMLSVAESIRNRGSLRGVYGCKAKHIENESNDTYDLAVLAWSNSNFTVWQWKANSWGTDADIAKNHMNRNCQKIMRIEHHTFFKC